MTLNLLTLSLNIIYTHGFIHSFNNNKKIIEHLPGYVRSRHWRYSSEYNETGAYTAYIQIEGDNISKHTAKELYNNSVGKGVP